VSDLLEMQGFTNSEVREIKELIGEGNARSL